MRLLVVLTTVLLGISGIVLHYREAMGEASWLSILAIVHLWGGMFFLVIFPLYAWDHISMHRRRLKKLSWNSSSGILQLLSGIGLIGSGVIIMLYSVQTAPTATVVHFYLTFFLAVALALHFWMPK